MKKRFIFITLLFAAISINVSAQESSIVHEYSFYGGGGLSALSYKLNAGDRSGGGGGEFGIGYTYLMLKERAVETGRIYHTRWGIHAGIGLGFYGAKAKINNSAGSELVTPGLVDYQQRVFDLYTTSSEYTQTQRAMTLNIPIMAQYHIDQYYVMGGFKFGIPLNGKFSSEQAFINNRAYYPDYDSWLTSQEFAGLGRVSAPAVKDGEYKFGTSVMFALEGGMKWAINSNLTLYTGLYFDIGLNDIAKSNNDMKFVEYTVKADGVRPANFTTNSVLSAFEEKINLIAFGVKVRLGYVR